MKYSFKKKQKVVLLIILFTSAFQSTIFSSSIYSSPISQQPSGEIKVVTSLTIIADWAKEIGDGLFTPAPIVTGGEDPHTFELLGSDIQMIENSDLFIVFGREGLEPWLEKVLPAGHTLNVLYLITEDMIEIDPVTGAPNPHVWVSPVLAKIFVQNITNEVIFLDFEHKSQYEINRDNYLSELDDLITDIESNNQFKGLKVVVHHPAFMYLLDLLGVVRVGVIEEHEGSEPSAQHIGEIVEIMLEENVSIIITQPQIEEKMIIQIARDTGAKLAKLTPLLGVNNINTYISMIEFNLLALANPEEVTDGGWIVIAIILGSSLLAITSAILTYFRYIKK